MPSSRPAAEKLPPSTASTRRVHAFERVHAPVTIFAFFAQILLKNTMIINSYAKDYLHDQTTGTA